MSPVLEAGQNIAKRTLQEVAAHARAASASQVYIYLKFYNRNSGSVPDAELKISLECLEKWSIETSNTAFFTFFRVRIGIRSKEFEYF
jgi:hypothetical protein